MQLIALCNRRSVALQISAATDQASMSWQRPQPDTLAFQQQLIAEKPLFAVITDDYLTDTALFTGVRTVSPETLIVVCLSTSLPQDGWKVLDALVFDALCTVTELKDCLLMLKTGRFYQSSLLNVRAIDQYKEPFTGWSDLSPAERRVLKGIAENKSGRQIANELYISEKTVNNHKAKVSQKLGINGGPGSLTRFILLHRDLVLASL